MNKENDLLAQNEYLNQKIKQSKKEKAEQTELLQQEKQELYQTYKTRYETEYEALNQQLQNMKNDPFWKIMQPIRAVVKSIWKFTKKQSRESAKTTVTATTPTQNPPNIPNTTHTVDNAPSDTSKHPGTPNVECRSNNTPPTPNTQQTYPHLITTPKPANIPTEKPKIAIQAHIYWADLIDEIVTHTNNIPFEFAMFISTDTNSKAEIISEKFKANSKANTINVEVHENRGRDVAPFLIQMANHIDNYDYICHIHTKKTDTGEHGDIWREYLYTQLLGSPASIESIIAEFEQNPTLGVAFPETFPTLMPHLNWSMSKDKCEALLGKLSTKCEAPPLPEKPLFPVGNMFWARVDAVKPLFKAELKSDDFPQEGGQIKGSTAHAVERIWVYLAKAQDYDHMVFLNMLPKKLHGKTSSCNEANTSPKSTTAGTQKKRIAIFAHNSTSDSEGSSIDNTITNSDIHLLKSIKAISDSIIFITSSELSENGKNSLKDITDKIIVRKSKGLDYGAWKDGILEIGFEQINKYDQLILINNSITGPVYDLNSTFESMNSKNVDFWGITAFPACTDSLYIARNALDIDRIPEYIESYFQVFENPVISSKIFRDFWTDLQYYDNDKSERKNAEIKMTTALESHGYKYDVYVKLSRYLRGYFGEYDMLYVHPYPLVIAGSPFVKKELSIYTQQEEKDKVNYILNSAIHK